MPALTGVWRQVAGTPQDVQFILGLHIIEPCISNVTADVFIPLRVDTPRLAASSSYRRKPVSRGPDWIPYQARNDGPGQKTIPRGLPRGGFILW